MKRKQSLKLKSRKGNAMRSTVIRRILAKSKQNNISGFNNKSGFFAESAKLLSFDKGQIRGYCGSCTGNMRFLTPWLAVNPINEDIVNVAIDDHIKIHEYHLAEMVRR